MHIIKLYLNPNDTNYINNHYFFLQISLLSNDDVLPTMNLLIRYQEVQRRLSHKETE